MKDQRSSIEQHKCGRGGACMWECACGQAVSMYTMHVLLVVGVVSYTLVHILHRHCDGRNNKLRNLCMYLWPRLNAPTEQLQSVETRKSANYTTDHHIYQLFKAWKVPLWPHWDCKQPFLVFLLPAKSLSVVTLYMMWISIKIHWLLL